MRRWAFGTNPRVVATAAALVFSAGLVTPGVGHAMSNSCKPGQPLVRHETKVCKPNQFRGAFTLTRACCMKANGKVKCRRYHKCPKHSISGLT